MQKICRRYNLDKDEDIIKNDELSDWMSISMAERIEYGYSLWADYCLMHGINIDKIRLQSCFKIVKLK